MILDEVFTLTNGVEIPKLGLGTWLIPDSEAAGTVKAAAALGYRHIDTAQAYGNEAGVGEGLRSSGVGRNDFFVTTKLAAESKNFADAQARIDASLRALKLDHIDLMLIHSPQPWAEFRQGDAYLEGNLEAWRALEDAYAAGKLRAIGVSNFERADLDNILAHGTVKPMVNQILAHIGATPTDLIEYSRANGMLVEAYSPVAHGTALRSAKLAKLAADYGVSVAQLCIRYCLELGLLPLPKTANADHMRENAAVDFTISPADVASLQASEEAPQYGEASAFPVFGRKRETGKSAVVN